MACTKKIFLVVFLDTYEKLTDDEKDSDRHEKLIYNGQDVPVDWWIENLTRLRENSPASIGGGMNRTF